MEHGTDVCSAYLHWFFYFFCFQKYFMVVFGFPVLEQTISVGLVGYEDRDV